MPDKKYATETEMDLESDFTIKISKLNFSYVPDKPILIIYHLLLNKMKK